MDFGIHPARFEIFKKRILFYHYILNKSENSSIFKVLEAQEKFPVRGDWKSCVNNDLKTLNIHFNTTDFKNLKKNKLIHILNEAISTSALQYLLHLRNSKGKEIIYTELEMSEYLKPNNSGLKILEKRKSSHIVIKHVKFPKISKVDKLKRNVQQNVECMKIWNIFFIVIN